MYIIMYNIHNTTTKSNINLQNDCQTLQNNYLILYMLNKHKDIMH